MSVVTGKSALAAVSEAVMDVLSVEAFSGLSGICPGGIWDDLPQDYTFPVTWFSVTEVPLNTFGHFGKSIELHLHVFSQAQGMREAQLIMAMAMDLLHAVDPVVTGFAFQYLDHLGTVAMPSFDVGNRSTKHLECRYTVLVLEAE